MRTLLFVALAAFLSAETLSKDQVATLVAELGSDDVATREAATQRLKSADAAALPQLRDALAGDAGKDAEHATRLRACIDALEWLEDWPCPFPEGFEETARVKFGRNPCVECGSEAPFTAHLLVDPALRRRFPKARFVVLKPACCAPAPSLPRVIGFGKDSPEPFALAPDEDPAPRIAELMAPVVTDEDAVEATRVLRTLIEQFARPGDFTLTEEKASLNRIKNGDRQVLMVTDRRIGFSATFDRDGRLKRSGYPWGTGK